ncbi:MAG: hypothetical protein K2Y37_07815 [Pirellulales bacterium]|nr:hypothetical protein [Pirellulales bacterium]
MATTSQADESSARASGLTLLAVFVALLVTGTFVRWPFARVGLLNDDFNFLQEIGLLETGRLSALRFLLSAHGPHLMPLWEAIFWLEWQLFGLEFAAWRVTIGMAHALAGCVLFAILRRSQLSTLGALTAAAAWGIIGAESFEGPLILIMCGNITVSLLGILGAMACVAGAGDRSGWSRVATFVGAGLIAIGAWSTSIFLMPASLLQIVLLRKRLGVRYVRWICAWLIVFMVACLSEAFVVTMAGGERAHLPSVGDACRRAMAIAANSLAVLSHERIPELNYLQAEIEKREVVDPLRRDFATLVSEHDGRGWAGTKLGWHGLRTGLGEAALAAAIVGLAVRGRHRWAILLVAWTGCVPLVLMSSLGGTARSMEESAQYARYLYVPSLVWCTTLGVTIDSLFKCAWVPRRLSRSSAQKTLVAVVVFAWLLMLAHQRYAAKYSRDVFEWLSGGSMARLAMQRELLSALATRSAAERVPLRVVDYAVDVPVPAKSYWPVSAFAATFRPTAPSSLTFVSAATATDDDWRRMVETLRQQESPAALALADEIEPLVRQWRLLAWMRQFAEQELLVVRLPGMKFSLPTRELDCDEVLATEGYEASAFFSCASVAAPLTATEREALRQRLLKSTAPEARTWLAMLFPDQSP